MDIEEIKIQTGIYKHFKGGTSLVYGLSDSSDKNKRVLYIGMQDGKYHDRPYNEFFDEVEFNGEKVARFSLIQPIEINAENILNNFYRNNNITK